MFPFGPEQVGQVWLACLMHKLASLYGCIEQWNKHKFVAALSVSKALNLKENYQNKHDDFYSREAESFSCLHRSQVREFFECLPHFQGKHRNLLRSHSFESTVIHTFMPHFVGFTGIYCRNESLPLKAIMPSSMAICLLGE